MNTPDHLHLGCGLTVPDGWLNVDGSWQVVLARHPWFKKLLVTAGLLPARQAEIPWNSNVRRLNLCRPLPFAEGTFRVIYASHLIEHLHHDHALVLLRECQRVLAPGGVCRMVVPDLAAIADAYQAAHAQGDEHAADRFMEALMVHDKRPPSGLMGLYYRLTAYHPHKWMYDSDSLQALFKEAGFAQIGQTGYLESRIERIAEVENAGRICEGQGIAVEGIKVV